MPIYLMLRFTDISWEKIQIFCKPAYIYMYWVYNTQSLTFLRVKWLSCSKSLGFIDSNAIMFNSFISDWAGPHNHFWTSANIKLKFD